jgi:predicted DNA-binding protein
MTAEKTAVPTQAISFRLPLDAIKRLNEAAAHKNISRGSLMRDIAEIYLQFLDEHPNAIDL